MKKISITGSKSETNRLLILKALYPNLLIENNSVSDDSEVMSFALSTEDDTIDIHHAGTAMRFLTAYFATQSHKTVVLTGSNRMKERPIRILVEALRQLDAEIEYLENEGFPPIKITGKTILKSKISITADVSSQYISALLLVAPKLKNGLELELVGKITSIPYINMTLSLLSKIGIQNKFEDNKIWVRSTEKIENQAIRVESDWSSASYFYSVVAMSEIGFSVSLSCYQKNSLQGDSILVEIYEFFGVSTIFEEDTIVIQKKSNPLKNIFSYNFSNCPDIAQTVAVTCFGLGIEAEFEGLHTLKIKETDRIEALKNELEKLGASISVTNHSLKLMSNGIINSGVSIKTYQDHRMAMAFAPLALKTKLTIEDKDVVSKSYPSFWKDFEFIGIN